MRVGFVGLGNMGVPMAANLLRAGHAVTVCDLDPARVKSFVEKHGGQGAASPADLAGSEFTITMLPDGADIRSDHGGSARERLIHDVGPSLGGAAQKRL